VSFATGVENKALGEAAVQRQWMCDLSSVLAPLALPGGYANFLAPDVTIKSAE
jgi:hypothetical protein